MAANVYCMIQKRMNRSDGPRRTRAVVAAVALAAAGLLGCSAPIAFAASRPVLAQSGARVTLAGTVVLKGSRSGVLAVRLPRPAEISVAEVPPQTSSTDVRIQGKGRITGFVLHGDGAWNRPTVFSLRVADCTSPGCTAPWPPFYYSWVNLGPTAQTSGTLPAGDYHLYLVADGAPTTVTIHFHGLPGRVVLTPPATASTRITEVKPALHVSPPALGPVVWAGGLTHSVTHWGALTIANLWYLVPLPNEEADLTFCDYYNSPPPPLIAYQSPLCNGANFLTNLAGPVGHHYGPLGVLGEYGASWIAGVIEPPGTCSDGESITVAGPVTSVDMQELVVNF